MTLAPILLSISAVALGLGCDLLPRATTNAARSASPPRSGEVETKDGQVTSAYRKMPPYPAAPVDPWAAVDGDQPRRYSEEDSQQSVRDNDFACTALHDHCFAPNVWLIENDQDVARHRSHTAAAYVFGPSGPALPVNANGGGLPSEPYTAYRTVPATKKNLKPGARVMALTFPRTELSRGTDVFKVAWNTGIVDRVDWDLGFVFLVGEDRNYWITATRVAVLSWKPGGKVEIIGGGARGSLAVRADEVILPDPATTP